MFWRAALSSLLLLLTIALLAYWGSNESARMARYEQGFQAQSIEVGAELFSQNCARCHGIHGEGVIGPALNTATLFNGQRLQEIQWVGSLETFLYQSIAAGRPIRSTNATGQNTYADVMPAWAQEMGGSLREDQIQNLVAYLQNYSGNWQDPSGNALSPVTPSIIPVGTNLTTPVLPVGDPARGKTLSETLSCQACHVNTTIGTPWETIGSLAKTRWQQPDYTGSATDATTYLRESIVSPTVYLAPGFTDSMTRDFGVRLDVQSLADLIAYLQSFP